MHPLAADRGIALEHFGSLRIASEEGNGVTMFGFNRREIPILAILVIPIAAVAVWVRGISEVPFRGH